MFMSLTRVHTDVSTVQAFSISVKKGHKSCDTG